MGRLVETTNDAPGYEVLGQVFGLRVHFRNTFSQMGTWLKSLVGGELKGMTKDLEASRQEVIDRLAERVKDRHRREHHSGDAPRHVGDRRRLDRDLRLRRRHQGEEDGPTAPHAMSRVWHRPGSAKIGMCESLPRPTRDPGHRRTCPRSRTPGR